MPIEQNVFFSVIGLINIALICFSFVRIYKLEESKKRLEQEIWHLSSVIAVQKYNSNEWVNGVKIKDREQLIGK